MKSIQANSFSSLLAALKYVMDQKNNFTIIGWRFCKNSHVKKEYLFLSQSNSEYAWITLELLKKEFNENVLQNFCNARKIVIDQKKEDEFPKKYKQYLQKDDLLSSYVSKRVQSKELEQEQKQKTVQHLENSRVNVQTVLYGSEVNEEEERKIGKESLQKFSSNIKVISNPYEQDNLEIWNIIQKEKPIEITQSNIPNSKHGLQWLIKRFKEVKKEKYQSEFKKREYLSNRGLPSYQFWSDRIEELKLILEWKLTTPTNIQKQQFLDKQNLQVQTSAERQFKTKIILFLNYILVSFNWKSLPERLRDVLDIEKVSSFCIALGSPKEFGFTNPQTIRGYLDILISIMRWTKLNTHVFTFVELNERHEIHTLILSHYNKWEQIRDQETKHKKSISYLHALGKYIEMKDFVLLFQKCIDICSAFIQCYNDLNLDSNETKQLIHEKHKSNGKIYHDSFLIITILLTFFNRAEIYYQSSFSAIRMFLMKPPNNLPFYQYIFCYTGPEKVSRTIDTSTFAFGEQWNAITYFYKNIIYPDIISSETVDTLFLRKNGEAMNMTRADCFTSVLKKITKSLCGQAFNSRDLRFIGNAHCKNQLPLTTLEKETLDKATNHSNSTAEKFYSYTQKLDTCSKFGSSIILKFLQYQEEIPTKISKDISDKLNDTEKFIFLKISEKIPKIKELIDEYDKKITILENTQSNQKDQEKNNIKCNSMYIL